MGGTKNWDDEHRLEYDLKLHKELSKLYELITKLVIICIRKKIPLIIENPYSTQHYLVRYWAIKSKVVIRDRSTYGDYYKKPTQFWFINCEPTYNFIFGENLRNVDVKTINSVNSKVERSLIAPIFANRFIREYIMSSKELEELNE